MKNRKVSEDTMSTEQQDNSTYTGKFNKDLKIRRYK